MGLTTYRGMTFLGVYQASCGRISMKIGGNQAGAFPDLPTQPRNLNFVRKTQFAALAIFNIFRRFFVIREFLYSPYSCRFSEVFLGFGGFEQMRDA